MDVNELCRLLNEYDPKLNIERLDGDYLVININEYLSLSAAEANEMLVLNDSTMHSYHWHMETEKMAGFIIDILKGNVIIIERVSLLGKVLGLPWHYKIVKKAKFEKIKHQYIGKKKVRIYSGNSIIQIAD
ncbi:MAG: hypothetical protein KMY54_08565 [Erysipelothrix sp.]|nr:hypothetical protein [Erysipelothrix sp.]